VFPPELAEDRAGHIAGRCDDRPLSDNSTQLPALIDLDQSSLLSGCCFE
jgi:hypothetical protein